MAPVIRKSVSSDIVSRMMSLRLASRSSGVRTVPAWRMVIGPFFTIFPDLCFWAALSFRCVEISCRTERGVSIREADWIPVLWT